MTSVLNGDLKFTLLFVWMKNFHVENLLQGKKTEKFDGEVISTRLKDGIIYTPKERSFLTKTVCTYLMENCERYCCCSIAAAQVNCSSHDIFLIITILILL